MAPITTNTVAIKFIIKLVLSNFSQIILGFNFVNRRTRKNTITGLTAAKDAIRETEYLETA